MALPGREWRGRAGPGREWQGRALPGRARQGRAEFSVFETVGTTDEWSLLGWAGLGWAEPGRPGQGRAAPGKGRQNLVFNRPGVAGAVLQSPP